MERVYYISQYTKCGCASQEDITNKLYIWLKIFFEEYECTFKKRPSVLLGKVCHNCYHKHNLTINSTHVHGEAVDIEYKTQEELYWILNYCLNNRIKRIGINPKYIHIDIGSKNEFKQNIIFDKCGDFTRK